MQIRTFVAVLASNGIRRAARGVTDLLLPAAGDVIWVAPENLHWTLQFLGEVKQLEVPAICRAVALATAKTAPFELTAQGIGAFPSIERPRTLWIGAGQGAETLVELQMAVQSELENLDYLGEARRYIPHLTLGRAGRHSPPQSLAHALATLADFEAGTMLVDEVLVFSSRTRQSGSIYEVLARASLAG